MALPKWTDERTETLSNFVGDESPVSRATVAEAAEALETSTRSISSKLRKMGFEVESATAAPKGFTDEQASALETFVTDNSGEYTYAEIAEYFEDGNFSAKQIQGKILSMELTGHVKPAPKVEAQRSYSPEEEKTFIEMAKSGASIEAIAEKLNRSVNSARGKALSLYRQGEANGGLSAIPKQEHKKSDNDEDPLDALGDIADMTVEGIAEAIGKTVRGVRTMLTRRGRTCSNYDGAARKEKAAASK